MPAFDVDAITLESLRTRRSAKWRYMEPDVIPAWVAEMDFPLAAPITDVLRRAVEESDTGYLFVGELPAALAQIAERDWGWPIPAERVLVMPDVLSGINQCLQQLTSPGDGVVITPPVYHPFFTVVSDVAHRRVVEVPLVRSSEGVYAMDLDALDAAFARPDVTAFLMSSPHNPTGSVPSPGTLRTIAELAARHGVSVIADEIHAPLVLPGAAHTPYLSVVDEDADAVSLLSATKAWNVPGLKCAQLVTTARTAETVAARIPVEVTYGAGHFGVIATLAAYRDGGPWLAEVIAILDGNRSLLADLLAQHLPRARFVQPQASYLAWIDLTDYDLGDDPAVPLLERGRVALSGGPMFGTQGSGFARLNFATSPAILRQIVDRMTTVIQ